ncbi:MAG: FAD-dependent thymidylate synthase [Candidatus Babeliales bacterium]
MPWIQPTTKEHCSQPHKIFADDAIGFVELIETFGNDLTVVNAARVSFNKESEFQYTADQTTGITSEQLSVRDQKLVEYLAEHKHIAPFFHPQLRFRIKMPIFVVREWYRHTVGFARNEVSRRYVTDAPDFFIPSQFRKRDANIKQGSSKEVITDNEHEVATMKAYTEQALEYYNQLLDRGVCPEQARMILPQSMYTEFIETASLAGYARLVQLRAEATAQREIQIYAGHISSIVQTVFPVSWKALLKNN